MRKQLDEVRADFRHLVQLGDVLTDGLNAMTRTLAAAGPYLERMEQRLEALEQAIDKAEARLLVERLAQEEADAP